MTMKGKTFGLLALVALLLAGMAVAARPAALPADADDHAQAHSQAANATRDDDAHEADAADEHEHENETAEHGHNETGDRGDDRGDRDNETADDDRADNETGDHETGDGPHAGAHVSAQGASHGQGHGLDAQSQNVSDPQRGHGLLNAMEHVPERVQAHLQSIWDAFVKGVQGVGSFLVKPLGH